MTLAVNTLLMRAEQLGVKLWVEQGNLRYRCRAGTVPRDLLDELGAHKASLLEHFSRQPASAAGEDLVPHFKSGQRTLDRVPSFRQASWYALKEGLNGVDSTNCRFVVRVRGYLDVNAVSFAFEELRRCHEVLSATMMEEDGRPWLSFQSKPSNTLELRDVSNLPVADREKAARAEASELVWRTFEVTRGSMFRPFLLTLDEDDHILGFVVHHLITDTISMRLLSGELIRNYSLKAAGHAPAPSELTLTYSDYLLCSTEWLSRPATQVRLREWVDRFADAPPMDLVNRPSRAPTPDRSCTRYRFEIDAELTNSIAASARQLRTSKFVVLLTVQQIMLSILTDRSIVTMGAVVSGRELPILNPVVGYLADRVHWITDLSGDPTFAEALVRVNESYLQAMRHQFFRSDMVQQALAVRGKELHAPVCNFMPYARSRAHLANDRFSGFDVDAPPFSTIPLPGISYWLALSETPQLIRGDLRFPHGSAERLVTQLLSTLRRTVQDPSIRLSALRSFAWQ